MSYRGHVQNGTVIFDDTVVLPEGASVHVDLVADSQESDEAGATCLLTPKARNWHGERTPARRGVERGPLPLRATEAMTRRFADTSFYVAAVNPARRRLPSLVAPYGCCTVFFLHARPAVQTFHTRVPTGPASVVAMQ